MNGAVQYHKSEAPRRYLENSLSLLNCMLPVLERAIHSPSSVTTPALISKSDPMPCHHLMMIHASFLPLQVDATNLSAC